MDLKLFKMLCKDSEQHHVMFHELYSVSSLLCIAQNVRFEIPYKVLYFETPFLMIFKYYAWASYAWNRVAISFTIFSPSTHAFEAMSTLYRTVYHVDMKTTPAWYERKRPRTAPRTGTSLFRQSNRSYQSGWPKRVWCWKYWLFTTIYTGKPVGLRFGQRVSKFPYWEIQFGTGAYHLQKSLPFTYKTICTTATANENVTKQKP